MDASDNAAQPAPLTLTAAEGELLHEVACRLVEAAARNARTSIDEFPLGRLADYPLVGVFVTLRKREDLRGCIGNFAANTPLSNALERAAVGVVSHDPRFPPVTPDELPNLTLSLSLLHTRELLEGDPHQRIDQVEIGEHGLDIQFQNSKGLLLPSVATDFGLNQLGFLQAVCRKANLSDNTWQHPDAILYRFSTIKLSGPWTADK